MESFISSMLRCCVIISFSKLAVADRKMRQLTFAVCDYDAIDRARLCP